MIDVIQLSLSVPVRPDRIKKMSSEWQIMALRSEVLAGVATKNPAFWDVTPCSLRRTLQFSATLHSITFQKSAFFRPKCLFLGSWKQDTNIVNHTLPNMGSQIPNSNFVYDSVNYFCFAWFRRNLQIWLLLHVK